MRASHSHQSSLDGLRGVALLMVFFHHLDYYTRFLSDSFPARVARQIASQGWTGVDIFFVLSGFLITRNLVGAKNATNYYGAFYARRVLRLFPVYYGILILVFLVPGLPGVSLSHVPFSSQIYFWLNASNLLTAFHPRYLGTISVFWSLAIEEQFYLVWPTVVRRCSAASLIVLCAAGVVAEVLLRQLPIVRAHEIPGVQELIYRGTPFHCDGLLIGAATALLISQGLLKQTATRWLFAGSAFLFLIWSTLLMTTQLRDLVTPIVSLSAAGLIAALVLSGDRGRFARCLRWKPFRLVGRYSYFMYATQAILIPLAITHVVDRVRYPNGWLHYATGLIVTIGVSFVLGALSWRFVESPINNLKRRYPYRFPAHSGVEAGTTVEQATLTTA